jgi:hypothetical protein
MRWRRYGALYLAVIVVVVLAVLGTRGSGPWGEVAFLRDLGGTSDEAPTSPGREETASRPTDTAPSGQVGSGVDASEYVIPARDPGDCLTWTQGGDIAERSVREVDCEQPHLWEVTGTFTVDGDGYAASGPSESEWTTLIDLECGPMAEAHIGGPLDPAGRFQPTAFLPTPYTWEHLGDREVLCGIAVRTGLDTYEEFTGRVTPSLEPV